MANTLTRTALLIALLLPLGCGAQVTPNPSGYGCPSSGSSAYIPLNQNAPTSQLGYTDTLPKAGNYCYIAQSVNGTLVSLPSNIAGPFTADGTNSVGLTWDAPTSGIAPTGYIVSRALATSGTVAAPTMNATAVIAQNSVPSLRLRGRVR